jgi:hypothetical protein
MKEQFLEAYKTLRSRCKRLLVDGFVSAGVPVSGAVPLVPKLVRWPQYDALLCFALLLLHFQVKPTHGMVLVQQRSDHHTAA